MHTLPTARADRLPPAGASGDVPTGPPIETLASAFRRVRAATEALAAPLSPEDCQVQSMPDASPTKWHLAHVTWFFETFVLERHEPDFRPHDPAFRVLFNSYYQGIGDRHPRPQRGLVSRPTLAEVLRYRAAVDARMAALLDTAATGPAAPGTGLAALTTLGLHHEQQHQELLLTDIKHVLSFSPAGAAYLARPDAEGSGAAAPPIHWCGFDGGLLMHGHDPDTDGAFCFDNETPRHRTYVAPFELASRPVTQGEYLDFIADGGYRQPAWWLAAGWDWVQAGHREAPLYWHRDGAGWCQHTLHGTVAVDPAVPACHLSLYEADAYARWAGARLPTEGEWEHAARHAPRPGRHDNLADSRRFHPRAAAGASLGLQQMYGDVWEWTQSAYGAYPGYRPLPGAVGEYNGKFMCSQFVLRGGSCATPAGHVRASYRNFFPPEAQWQFSGLRLARDV